jgi:hypothetical protein
MSELTRHGEQAGILVSEEEWNRHAAGQPRMAICSPIAL